MKIDSWDVLPGKHLATNIHNLIELDEGKILTGKPYSIFDGKTHGFRLRFSRENQAFPVKMNGGDLGASELNGDRTVPAVTGAHNIQRNIDILPLLP